MSIEMQAHISTLMETRHGKNEGDVDAFEDVIWNIYDRNDPRDIVYLCDAFDDNTPHADMTGPLQTLDGAIGEYFTHYNIRDITAHFIIGITRMLPHAENWAQGLLYGYVIKKDEIAEVVAMYCQNFPNERLILRYLADKAQSKYADKDRSERFKLMLMNFSN